MDASLDAARPQADESAKRTWQIVERTISRPDVNEEMPDAVRAIQLWRESGLTTQSPVRMRSTNCFTLGVKLFE